MAEKKSEEYYRTRGDNEFGSNYIEYSVEKKNEGAARFKRLLFILGYAAVSLVYILLFVVLTKFVPLVAILPLILWILIFFTWRYVNIEYEYAIIQGSFRFSEIYGHKSRSDKLEAKIKDMSLIAPYDDEYRAKADAPDIKRKYSFISSLSSPDVYFGLWTNEDGEKCSVLFEATNKTLKICKFYNAGATVVRQMRY